MPNLWWQIKAYRDRSIITHFNYMETTGYSNAIWKISSGSMKQTLCATYPLTACWIGCALSWIFILCSLAYDDEMALKFAPGSTKADALSFCRSSIHKDDNKASASVTRVGTFLYQTHRASQIPTPLSTDFTVWITRPFIDMCIFYLCWSVTMYCRTLQ